MAIEVATTVGEFPQNWSIHTSTCMTQKVYSDSLNYICPYTLKKCDFFDWKANDW